MRPQAKIDAEIAALELAKSYAPKRTMFGDDNHKKIDLQIEELRDGIDDTCEEWEDFNYKQQQAILEARKWKEGDSDDTPSAGWDIYKPAKKGGQS